MIGTTNLPLRTGGYIIPVETTDSTNRMIMVNVPSGARIMCMNCSLDNESTLISNGSISKVSNGYFIRNKIDSLKILRPLSNMSPLTIIRGNEILYCDSVVTDSGVKFNVPKGFRINGTMCTINGENIVPEKNNYLIEY